MATAYQVAGAIVPDIIATTRQCGPFYLGNKIFVVAFSSTELGDDPAARNTLSVFKSEDEGQTWEQLDCDVDTYHVGTPDLLRNVSFSTCLDANWPANPYVHVLHWEPVVSLLDDVPLTIRRFNMATEGWDQVSSSPFLIQMNFDFGSGIGMHEYFAGMPRLGSYLEVIFYHDYVTGGAGFSNPAKIARVRVTAGYTWDTPEFISVQTLDGSVQNHASGASGLGYQGVLGLAAAETLSGPDEATRGHLISSATGVQSGGAFSDFAFGGGLGGSNLAPVKTATRLIAATDFFECLALGKNDSGWRSGQFFLDGSAISFFHQDHADIPLTDSLFDDEEAELGFVAATPNEYLVLWWAVTSGADPERRLVYAQRVAASFAAGGVFTTSGLLVECENVQCRIAWGAAPVSTTTLGILFCTTKLTVNTVWFLAAPLTAAPNCPPIGQTGGNRLANCSLPPQNCGTGVAF